MTDAYQMILFAVQADEQAAAEAYGPEKLLERIMRTGTEEEEEAPLPFSYERRDFVFSTQTDCTEAMRLVQALQCQPPEALIWSVALNGDQALQLDSDAERRRRRRRRTVVTLSKRPMKKNPRRLMKRRTRRRRRRRRRLMRHASVSMSCQRRRKRRKRVSTNEALLVLSRGEFE